MILILWWFNGSIDFGQNRWAVVYKWRKQRWEQKKSRRREKSCVRGLRSPRQHNCNLWMNLSLSLSWCEGVGSGAVGLRAAAASGGQAAVSTVAAWRRTRPWRVRRPAASLRKQVRELGVRGGKWRRALENGWGAKSVDGPTEGANRGTRLCGEKEYSLFMAFFHVSQWKKDYFSHISAPLSTSSGCVSFISPILARQEVGRNIHRNLWNCGSTPSRSPLRRAAWRHISLFPAALGRLLA